MPKPDSAPRGRHRRERGVPSETARVFVVGLQEPEGVEKVAVILQSYLPAPGTLAYLLQPLTMSAWASTCARSSRRPAASLLGISVPAAQRDGWLLDTPSALALVADLETLSRMTFGRQADRPLRDRAIAEAIASESLHSAPSRGVERSLRNACRVSYAGACPG